MVLFIRVEGMLFRSGVCIIITCTYVYEELGIKNIYSSNMYNSKKLEMIKMFIDCIMIK